MVVLGFNEVEEEEEVENRNFNSSQVTMYEAVKWIECGH